MSSDPAPGCQARKQIPVRRFHFFVPDGRRHIKTSSDPASDWFGLEADTGQAISEFRS